MEFKELLKIINSLGILVKPRRYRSNRNTISIVGEYQIEGNEVTLRLELPKEFPFVLPRCYWENYSEYPLMAHVFANNEICFVDRDSIVLNVQEPRAIIRDVLESSIETIQKGFRAETQFDLLNEMDLYWRGKVMSADGLGWQMIGEPVQQIELKYFADKVIGDSKQAVLQFLNQQKQVKPTECLLRSCVVIPIKSSKSLLPAATYWLERVTILWAIMDSISIRQVKYVALLLARFPNTPLILQVALPNGQYCFIGILRPVSLFYGDYFNRYEVFHVSRNYKTHLLERAGGNIGMSKKKVILVGCGSVGGYIAEKLVKTGIQELVLVDPDCLEMGNVYRHTLGANKTIGQNKANLLANELKEKVPNIILKAYGERIQTVILNGKLSLVDYDLIVVATGDPNTNLWLNKYIIQYYKGLPVVYTWLDPYGVGGHTLVTNNKGASGCYQCIYDANLQNQASFAKAGQKFVKALSGCDSYFMPFSDLDANQVAIEATRQIVKVLNGKELDNPLVSWKGEADLLLEAGFKLSERFQQTQETLEQFRYAYKNVDCMICGNKH